MAWTNLGSTPGNLRGTHYIDRSTPTFLETTVTRGAIVIGSTSDSTYHLGIPGRQLTPGGPLNLPDKYNTGWVDYSAGGGGGSSRPNTGFLYPRG